MNFQETEAYLYSLGNEVETMKLGLENITALLNELGQPHTKYRKVQVAGTNGKGSVCAFLSSICLHAGIKTGLYTSPHLISITERVKIDGNDIAEEEFARLATTVRETAERLTAMGRLAYLPTFFEQISAIALLAFAGHHVELAILETGLGGRWDATTAANAEIAAITRIDLDHQEYLGDTIEEIAGEKAAIIRSDSVVCVGRQPSAALEVIKGKCDEVGVSPKTLEFARFGRDSIGAEFSINGFQADEVVLSLNGAHQVENAALAILVAKNLGKVFKVSNENIYLGLESARHPGRIEWIEKDGIRILLDGAHNRSGAVALADYLRTSETDANIVLIYASMKGKDTESILKVLLPRIRDVILTEPRVSRAKSAFEMAAAIEGFDPKNIFVVPQSDHAFASALMIAEGYPVTRRKFVLVTGSLYLVGEVKKLLNN